HPDGLRLLQDRRARGALELRARLAAGRAALPEAGLGDLVLRDRRELLDLRLPLDRLGGLLGALARLRLRLGLLVGGLGAAAATEHAGARRQLLLERGVGRLGLRDVGLVELDASEDLRAAADRTGGRGAGRSGRGRGGADARARLRGRRSGRLHRLDDGFAGRGRLAGGRLDDLLAGRLLRGSLLLDAGLLALFGQRLLVGRLRGARGLLGLDLRLRLARGALVHELLGLDLRGRLARLLLGLLLRLGLFELLEDLVLVQVAVLVRSLEDPDFAGLEVGGRALDGEAELLRQREKLLRLRFHRLRKFVQPQATTPGTRSVRT